MPSILTNFINECVPQSNTVMGTDSITLSGGMTLTGVWSPLSGDAEGAMGGEELMASAVLVVPAASGIDRTLIGETGTYDGDSLRVQNIEKDTCETRIFFEHDTEGLM